MITCYFGVPGCGKTTILTKIAQKELKRIKRGKSKYNHILTNFYCQGCEMLDFNHLSKFYISDSLILLDEITLESDSRDFKTFSKGHKDFFTLHRHLGNDIVVFCQDYSRMDKTIRNNVYDLWYVTKPVFPILRSFSVARRIYRNIAINEMTSELTLGYRFATFWERIFSSSVQFVFRKPYYKYFNSFDTSSLAGRPSYIYESWDLPKSDVLDGEKIE